MAKVRIIPLLAGMLIALVVTASGCQNKPQTTNVDLGRNFGLKLGQTANISSESLQIKFQDMLGDSRCPLNAVCIWAGEVTCTLELNYGGKSFTQTLVKSGSGAEYGTANFNDYQISFDVQPYPEAGKTISKTDYQLKLIVNKQPQPTDNLEISPAPIHEVTVNLLKSNPPQVSVHILGGLRDGCTTFNDIQTTRGANRVDIQVTTRHPKDAVCTAIYGYFEKDVNLGSDFAAGTTYTLNVNDRSTTFAY